MQWGLKCKYVRFNVKLRLKRTDPQVCVQWGLKRDLRIVWLKRHSVPFGTYYTTKFCGAKGRNRVAALRLLLDVGTSTSQWMEGDVHVLG